MKFSFLFAIISRICTIYKWYAIILLPVVFNQPLRLRENNPRGHSPARQVEIWPHATTEADLFVSDARQAPAMSSHADAGLVTGFPVCDSTTGRLCL